MVDFGSECVNIIVAVQKHIQGFQTHHYCQGQLAVQLSATLFYITVKVQVSLEQAMKVQRERTGIALTLL
jgi:hypothetical protein